MRKITAFIVILMILAVSGCGSSPVEPAAEDSPKDVYLTYMAAIERGDYVRAEGLLSSSIKEQLLGTATALGKTRDVVIHEIKFVMDLKQYNSIDISSLREEIEGNRAKVFFKSKADNEEGQFEGYYKLFKENGNWKLETPSITVIPS